MHFNPALLLDYWPLLLQGAWLTVQVSAAALVIGYAAGVAVAMFALMPGRLPRFAAGLYVETLRNIPFIILIFVVYYGLPFSGIRLPATVAGALALALFVSAYYAEIVRAEIRRALVPPSTNMTLTMMKESAVLSSITVPELTYQSLVVQGNTFAPFEVFAAVASIYWLIAIVIAELSRRLELRVGAVQVESINHNPIAERYLSLVARRA